MCTPAAPPDTLIQIEVLEQLCDEIDPESVLGMVETFLAELPGHLAHLVTLLATSDRPALERAAHSMKGAAGSLGCGALEAAAARLERAALPAGQFALTCAFVELRQAAHDVRPALGSWLTGKALCPA